MQIRPTSARKRRVRCGTYASVVVVVVVFAAGAGTTRPPTNSIWMSASVLFFVSGTTVAENTAPSRQNTLNTRNVPAEPTHRDSSLDTYVTTNTNVQLVNVARLVPKDFT